ncbi:MAG: OmpA family protein [Deltaproteobacteria bacterium]|nr:OmpA family protein [Deltaproteobacteria bacterium]
MPRSVLRQLLIGSLWGALLAPGIAGAQTKQPDFTLIHPNTSGGRFLTLHEAETLQQWRYNMGLYLYYLRRPISAMDLTTSRRADIVRNAVNVHLVGAVGFTDWVQGGLAVPVTVYESFFNPDVQANAVTFGTAQQQNRAGIGDIRAEAKFRLIDIDRYKFGVAVLPYMLFPSGKKSSFISNAAFSPGVKAVLEGNIRDRVWVGLNLGYQYVRRSDQFFADDANAIFDDRLTFGLGSRLRLTDDWSLVGEALAETNAKTPFRAEIQTPVELMAGAQWTPQRWSTWRGLNITLMGGSGITRGVGSPEAHVLLGINYRRPKIVALGVPKGEIVDVKVEEKIVISQRIHFEFNRSVLRPISFPILNDVAAILKQSPQIGKVQVEGHTDWIGSDVYNQRLSEARARSVVDYLARQGVDRARLVPIGYGEARPIGDNNTVEGRAKNRRTEFTVLE